MSVRISVEQGDISAFDGDAVVNAANNHLVLGAGVAGAIRRRGGPSIQAECDRYVQEHGPIDVGDAVLTGGGDLTASHVIHAAAMGDQPTSAHTIRSATRHSMELAHEHGIRSIAFPILGTGVAGFDFGRAAEIMVEEIRRAAEGRCHPETVALYGYLDDQASILRSLVEAGSSRISRPRDRST